MARRLAGDIPFLEVFIDTPLRVCEARDPKGLYVLARRGKIPNFTGMSAPYEAPDKPDVVARTEGCTVGQSAESLILTLLQVSELASARDGGTMSEDFEVYIRVPARELPRAASRHHPVI